jgi:hypothetical protein
LVSTKKNNIKGEEMKKLLVIVSVMVLLISCTTMLPLPEQEGNSLVIGSFILDFPDGFFNLSPRKFDMNVQLHFKNVTQGSSFTLRTSRGYFYFLTNGTDKYVLEYFKLGETKIGDTTYTFGGETLNFQILTTPNKVIYLGHIVFTEAGSDAAKRSGRTSIYEFEPSTTVDWNRDFLLQYISDHQGGPWLQYEIVEYGKR